jgi:hypothetical protein
LSRTVLVSPTAVRTEPTALFWQYNAPADLVETANTIGLPRYAMQAVEQQFALGHAARAVKPAADLHAAAGADQGQVHLMTAFQSAVNATPAARCPLHARSR